MTTINNMLEEIQKGINEICENGKLKQNFTMKNLLNFKNKGSCINNAIALIQTCLFLDELVKRNIITREQKADIIKNLAKPNANGYDVFDKTLQIAAELKGTVPCKDDKFGANQKNSIKKDIKKLQIRASKNKGKEIVESGFERYMVLFDVSREAMKDLEDICKQEGINIIYIDSDKEISDEIKKDMSFNFNLENKLDLV